MSIQNRIGTGNSQIKQRLGIKPKAEIHTGLPTKEGDARFRLIQKKRQNITDARDRLAEIAKGSDARIKINKLKKLQQTTSAKPQVFTNGVQKNKGFVAARKPFTNKPRATGTQLVRKVGNSQPGKTGFVTRTSQSGTDVRRNIVGNKAQLKGGALTRTVNRRPQLNSGAFTKPANRRPQIVKKNTNIVKAASNVNAERYHPLPNNPNVVTIRNDQAFTGQSNQRFTRQPQLKGKRFQQMKSAGSSPSMRSPLPFRQSNQPSWNDIETLVKTFGGGGNAYDSYRINPLITEEFKPARLKITTANNYMDYEAPVEDERYRFRPSPRMPSVKRNSYDDFDGYYDSTPKRQALSDQIISRMNQTQPQQRSSPAGYKVMVMNLHPMVTVEDVEELFRNVGPLKYARLVQEGMAEVVFVNEVDAYRSVEVYHNRQLDGQPMNVMVLSSLPSSYSPQPSRRSGGLPLSAPSSRQNQMSKNVRQNQMSKNVRQNQMSKSVQRTASQNQMSKSVLRSAGGTSYSNHESVISSLSNKRSQKVDVAPDINAIHHALFSGRNRSSAINSNPQVYIKLPKQSSRARK